MDYQLHFKEGKPPELGAQYLFWMSNGLVTEGVYWERDGAEVVTVYSMVEPMRPEASTHGIASVRAWAHCQQVRSD